MPRLLRLARLMGLAGLLEILSQGLDYVLYLDRLDHPVQGRSVLYLDRLYHPVKGRSLFYLDRVLRKGLAVKIE